MKERAVRRWAGRPCLDAIPMPGDTNEVAFFQAAFENLVATYGGLFDLVSYDAGGFSRSNADAVVTAGKHYLFALKDEHPAMCRFADGQLALLEADPTTTYGDRGITGASVWPHARSFLSVKYVKLRDGVNIG